MRTRLPKLSALRESALTLAVSLLAHLLRLSQAAFGCLIVDWLCSMDAPSKCYLSQFSSITTSLILTIRTTSDEILKAVASGRLESSIQHDSNTSFYSLPWRLFVAQTFSWFGTHSYATSRYSSSARSSYR